MVSEPLAGSFGSVAVTIVNISDCGVRIVHSQPLRIATKARLWFKRADISVSGQGLVVWSRLSPRPDEQGKLLYQSGVRLQEGVDDLRKAMETLVMIGVLRPDSDSLQRKLDRQQMREQARTGKPVVRIISTNDLPADQLLLIQHARARLRDHPEEAAKWYQRARFTMDGPAAEGASPVGYQRDILAVWEFLERSVELPIVVRAFEKLTAS